MFNVSLVFDFSFIMAQKGSKYVGDNNVQNINNKSKLTTSVNFGPIRKCTMYGKIRETMSQLQRQVINSEMD